MSQLTNREQKFSTWCRDNSITATFGIKGKSERIYLRWRKGSYIGSANSLQGAIDMACSRKLAFDEAEYERLLSI